MIKLTKSELDLLIQLVDNHAEIAHKTLSEGLYSDNADKIGHGSAVLRELDSIRKKLEQYQ